MSHVGKFILLNCHNSSCTQDQSCNCLFYGMVLGFANLTASFKFTLDVSAPAATTANTGLFGFG